VEEMDNIEEAIANMPPDSYHPDSSIEPDLESPTPRTSTAPSQHTATLQTLEGRPPNRDDSSDDEDHEMSQLPNYAAQTSRLPEKLPTKLPL
jgi:hypothetical protein